MRVRMNRALALFALLMTVALPACDDGSIVDTSDESGEKFAEEVRSMSNIDGVDVFVGTTRRYLFVDGSREDAISLSSVTVDGTILVVNTVSQGTYYFDLGKALSLNASEGWVILTF